jgi:hypothetical protein
MDKLKDWAKLLNGREYGMEITNEEEARAKKEGIIVVFGASDDLMEIRGFVEDELSCFEGGSAYFNDKGLIENKCNNDECPYFSRSIDESMSVTAIWDIDGYSWGYETNIPHEAFDIMEDGEKYCRGIVFYIKDAIQPHLKEKTDTRSSLVRELVEKARTLSRAVKWYSEYHGDPATLMQAYADVLDAQMILSEALAAYEVSNEQSVI